MFYGQRSQLPNLVPIDFKLEKTLRRHKHIAIKDKIEMDLQQQQPAPQERPFKDYFSPLAHLSTSCIRYPNVTARSFKLKRSVLNCLSTFMASKMKTHIII